MQLKQLLNIHGKIDWRDQSSELKASSLCYDSREVKRDSVYIAIRGTSADGHRYLADVAHQGASVVIVEDVSMVPDFFRGAVVEVLDSRLTLQILSQRFFESAGDQMKSFAVTGTNGKTSVTYILEYFLNSLNFSCGVIGTIDHHLNEKVWSTELTTPDPITLQSRLKDFLSLGAQAFVIEASSHALKQNRMDQGVDFAIFTNLTRDHLDYHGTQEDYFNSKAKLFSDSMMKSNHESFAVINGDDPYGEQLAAISKRNNFLYGEGEQCDFRFNIQKENLRSTSFEVQFPDGTKCDVISSLVGKHNVYNTVAGLSCVYLAGLDVYKAASQFSKFLGIPGRLQLFAAPNDRTAFVDYAHTDDALRKTLGQVKILMKGKGRLLTVFGCGGDRDKGKRSLMGKVALDLSDKIFVTSDNPRTEDPQSIIDDICEDLPIPNQKIVVQVDRKVAIGLACKDSLPGDVIVVAGKGHEDYQIIGQQKYHFDDYEIIKELLSERVK